jgi:hypothetical protein
MSVSIFSERVGAAVLVLLLVACGGAESTQPAGDDGGTHPAAVASVSITGPASVGIGSTVKLSAAALDATGGTISGKTFAWTSSNDAVAGVATDGTVSGRTAGSASISAAVDGKTGSITVTVAAAPSVVASIVISGAATLQAGTSTQLTATVTDNTGAVNTTIPVTWTSSDQSRISVSNAGLADAVHIASVTITASAGGKSATTTITSALAPYTFQFDAGTSASDAALISDAVQFASTFYKTTFGRTITTPTVVGGSTTAAGCDARSGNAAFTGPGSVTFCVGNRGWQLNGPVSRQKIAMHELFHVWQFQYHWLGNPATAGADWAIEGSAELMGYSAVAAAGLLPFETTRGCMAKQLADFAKQQPPGLPPLPTLEPAQVFQTTVGPVYPYSLIAMDELTTGAHGLASLQVYGDAIAGGASWQSAFQTAFGTSVSAFYAQYPAYVAALAVPVNYLCGV